MDIESFRIYCLTKPGTTEGFPFDNDTLVFKVAGKMFALTSLSAEVFSVNLKCDPEYALMLREQYHQITPGYHMNKKHWNTVEMDPLLGEEFIQKLIDHSYDLVVAGLKKSDRDKLKDMTI